VNLARAVALRFERFILRWWVAEFARYEWIIVTDCYIGACDVGRANAACVVHELLLLLMNLVLSIGYCLRAYLNELIDLRGSYLSILVHAAVYDTVKVVHIAGSTCFDS